MSLLLIYAFQTSLMLDGCSNGTTQGARVHVCGPDSDKAPLVLHFTLSWVCFNSSFADWLILLRDSQWPSVVRGDTGSLWGKT